MRCLLDTHVWLWSVASPERLDAPVREIVESGEVQLALSPISIWEALLLHEHGRYDLGPAPIDGIDYALREYPLAEWPLTAAVAIRSRTIELPHRDPADRFLAATAIEHDAILLTQDRTLIAAPSVPTLQA